MTKATEAERERYYCLKLKAAQIKQEFDISKTLEKRIQLNEVTIMYENFLFNLKQLGVAID